MSARALLAVALLSSPIAAAQSFAPARPGFPVTLAGAGPVLFLKPIAADLDNDGQKEIIVGTSNHRLYVINPNGAVGAGWPVTLPSEIASSPAVGDVDGDGYPDIVVGCGSATDFA